MMACPRTARTTHGRDQVRRRRADRERDARRRDSGRGVRRMGGRGPAAPFQGALIGGAALLTATYFATPSTAVRASLWAVLGVLAALAVVLATHRTHAQDRLPGWLLAAGVALLGVGYAVSVAGPDGPSFADPPRLLAYAALAGAVIAFQRDRIRHDRDSLLDALVVTVAAAQAGWMVLIEPLVRDDLHRLAHHADHWRLPARPPAGARRRDPPRLRRDGHGRRRGPARARLRSSPGSPPGSPPTSPTGRSWRPAGSSPSPSSSWPPCDPAMAHPPTGHRERHG